ncbi:similar to Saccharomyces cerevisiae YNL329C PEX6 AAA-peroxin [Maudiozyma saulgeensis]|uniref:Peroxisomal ATPase PEX6 n=1 Tax=Maudiozyma saulgeensis TaxID=1789683 RepID=A0A1X7R1E1_9SACH|nr:similar to Saccharomyces cerevisiae YNL329C PEX6 AAA-peroxin [Kazachstania saulgeensis]
MKVKLEFDPYGSPGQIKVSEDLYPTSIPSFSTFAQITLPCYSKELQKTFIYWYSVDKSLPYETVKIPIDHYEIKPYDPTFDFCEFTPLENDFDEYVSPLDIIGITLDPILYDKISQLPSNNDKVSFLATKFDIRDKQSIIYKNQWLHQKLCSVTYCKPHPYGIIDFSRTKIILTKEKEYNNGNKEDSHIDCSNIQIACLPYHLPLELITPNVYVKNHDDTLFAYANHDVFTKLKISSGSLVQISIYGKSTHLRLFVLFQPNNFINNTIYLHPRVKSLYPSHENVHIQKCIIEETLPIASKVIVSRVGGWIQTQKIYQDIILQSLKAFFSNKDRIFKINDLIPITFDKSLSSLTSEQTITEWGDWNVSEVKDGSDTLVWFKITYAELKLSDGDDIGSSSKIFEGDFIIDPVNTKVSTSNIVRESSEVTLNEDYDAYYQLPSSFNYHPGIFPYYNDFSNIIRSSVACLKRGIAAETQILLHSTSSNVGKSTLVKRIATKFQINLIDFDCISFSYSQGSLDSITKIIGFLKAKLEAVLPYVDSTIVYMSHFDVLFPPIDPNQDQNTTKIARTLELGLLNSIGSVMKKYRNVIFVASVNEIDNLPSTARAFFKFEVGVPVPTEEQRLSIFEWYLSSKQLNQSYSPVVKKQKFVLGSDVDMQHLAVHSAGLTPIDICSIVSNAREDSIEKVCESKQNLSIELDMATLDKAISNARDEYSVSIGAPKIPNITWDDIGGVDQIKSEIMDTIDMPLKHPELFASGLKKRSGLLFYGPPGTGKTLMAKAIATNFSLNFFSVKGPELLNMYIGESEANVRRIFQKAREAKPCVIFFDEIDSVAPKRGNQGDSGGVMDRIVSQLLAELDGMSSGSSDGSVSEGIFVIGATNRPDLLDEALLRPGRFDKLLYLGIPDTNEKQLNILKALTRKFEFHEDVDLLQVAENCTFNYTGADFYALCSDAMLKAMTRIAHTVDKKLTEYNQQKNASQEKSVSLNYWFDQVATEEDTSVTVRMEDFVNAQKELTVSVSQDELNHYLKVKRDFEG